MNPVHANLWAATSPSALGALVAIVLVGIGLALALRFLGRHEEPAPGPSRPRDALDDELDAIAAARARLGAALDRAGPPLRAALAPSIEGPLADLAERVASLVALARSSGAAREGELARLESDRARAERELSREPDPRARALLEAQRRDLEATLAVRTSLARTARLAGLELHRLRTLLEALPSRVQELAARQLLEGAAAVPVDSIARSLESAVESTSQLLDEVVRDRVQISTT